MPRAADAYLTGALPVTHDPTARIDPQAKAPEINLGLVIQQFEDMITTYILPIIKDLTGIDLAGIAELLNALGVSSSLEALASQIQLVIDTILSALTNLPIVGGALGDIFEALHLIPPDQVQGAAGPANMFESIFGIINSILGGFVGSPGATGGSLADVSQVAAQVSSNASLGAYAWQLANIVNNTPVARGFMATGRANYDFTSTNTYLPTTQANALSASFGLLQAMPIGVVSWYGYGSSGITAFYVNIRKVNLETGVRTLVHHSGNIVGNLQPGSGPDDADFMFCELPTTPIAGEATDYYYVEWVSVGGTHYLRGMSFADNIKDHPTAVVPCYGTTVDYSTGPNTPTTDLPKATGGPDVPWVEFAVSVGDVADHHEPLIWTFDYDGESIVIPSWCNRVDAIPLGKGGDGHAGTLPSFNGEAGQPGKFAPVTWERGTDFTGDATFITFTAISDGSSKLSIPGHDTVAAAGANGASAKFNLTPVGQAPGIFPYNGQNYGNAVDQKAGGGKGTDPGGGGNGGNGFIFQAGGKGGKAAAWVCFRQIELDDESAGDSTPPIPGTVRLDDRTLSSITATPVGSVDA